MTSTPNLEHLSILSHSPEDQPTLDDTTYQNTRRSLGALTGCPRLRTLAIIYGGPESRPIRSWCRRTLTDALPVLLADQLSSTPAPHPTLQTLKLETTYRAVDLDRAWSSSVEDGLIETLCDRERYPAFRTCRAAPREVSKRVFAPFATRDTNADIDAEFMFGEPPRNGAIDREGIRPKRDAVMYTRSPINSSFEARYVTHTVQHHACDCDWDGPVLVAVPVARRSLELDH
ncbi:uncharacterized protein BXZ73DRAFT_108643 [Epithele typhae]|uniref:uncharacterized protein n=1 Tax=Epithele typhae TaxID=378194 RepID=UPI00200850D2|nr:uncharacterized protein BXZ73DRAFT_108643 [Epithele typhae]KAH9910691.1 hypothetical protein BXZ73DRAFT_108643 [Epithele typhae]